MPLCEAQIEEFIRRYSWENVNELALEYPDKRSLYVDYNDVYKFDLDLSNELIEHPDRVITTMENTLAHMTLPADVENFAPHVRIINMPQCDKIKRTDIKTGHRGRLIYLEGIIVKASDVRPVIMTAAYKCQRCGHVNYIIQDRHDECIEPFECENDACGRKGAFKLLDYESIMVDGQYLTLAELPEDIEYDKQGTNLHYINVELFDDIAGGVYAGNRVSIIGILQSFQKKIKGCVTRHLEYYIDVNSISVLDAKNGMAVEPSDIEIAYEIHDKYNGNPIPALVNSLAPSIIGYPEIKESMLLSMVSAGYTRGADGARHRGVVHGMIVGDPGLAKSQLKYAVHDKMPCIVLASGLASTEAGLTASAIKDKRGDGSGWEIQAGALAQANGSGIILDEWDKSDPEIQTHLNAGLEQGEFQVAKAGFNITLSSTGFAIFMLNPKNERFSRYEPIGQQLGAPASLLSRMDYVWAMKDTPNAKTDAVIADKILDVMSGKENASVAEIETDAFRAYIKVARSINPVFPQELKYLINGEYLGVRGRSGNDQVSVTSRYVGAAYRLALSEAKLCLSTIVTPAHILRALTLINGSNMEVFIDNAGNLDADLKEGGVGSSQRGAIRLLRNVISEISNSNGKYAALGEIVLAASEAGLDEVQINGYLKTMQANGQIIECAPQQFRNV